MKKYTVLWICCLVVFFSATTIYAQEGFSGPGANQNTGSYTGPSRTVTVTQAGTFANKTPVILTGNVVQALGGDRYTFRDSSGEMIVKISKKKMWGLSFGATDRVEISGELKRDKKNWQVFYMDVKYIKKI